MFVVFSFETTVPASKFRSQIHWTFGDIFAVLNLLILPSILISHFVKPSVLSREGEQAARENLVQSMLAVFILWEAVLILVTTSLDKVHLGFEGLMIGTFIDPVTLSVMLFSRGFLLTSYLLFVWKYLRTHGLNVTGINLSAGDATTQGFGAYGTTYRLCARND